jgi:hypothetical protein
MRRVTPAAFLMGLLMLPCSSWAQNTTSGGAYSIVPAGVAPMDFLDSTDTQRWYQFTAVSGRSYCAATQAGWINIFGTTTLIVSNDDTSNEPRGFRLSRACFIAPASERAYIRVTRFFSSEDFSFSLHVSESTLFSNWFFVGGDYSAFTLIRNTTNSTVPYTVNWRNSAGAVVATTSGTLAANGLATHDARGFSGALGAGSGTVEIVHSSSPDAIMATTTVLSGTTGLSFDSIFVKRANW